MELVMEKPLTPPQVEAPTLPSLRENRDNLTRLFQGYVNDFGNVAGDKIIRVILDELGGLRMVVPRGSKHPGENENLEIINRLYCRLKREFGDASGKVIMQRFVRDLKGLRMSFPDFQDLDREDRNRRIREAHGSITEISIRYGLSGSQIRRIKED